MKQSKHSTWVGSSSGKWLKPFVAGDSQRASELGMKGTAALLLGTCVGNWKVINIHSIQPFFLMNGHTL